MKQGLRSVAKGTNTVPASTTQTLATLTRATDECLFVGFFVTDAGVTTKFSTQMTTPPSNSVAMWLERTAVLNQYLVRVNNGTNAARTVQWGVMGFVPP